MDTKAGVVLHAWCARQSCPRGAADGYSKIARAPSGCGCNAAHVVRHVSQLAVSETQVRRNTGALGCSTLLSISFLQSLASAVASAHICAATRATLLRELTALLVGSFSLLTPGAIMAAVVTARPKVLVVRCLTQGSGTTAAAPRCTTDAVFCSPCLHPVMTRWEIRPRESLLSRRCSNREGSASPKRTT
jgi:hypothetical protein